MLSFFFSGLGESEAVAHIFMLGILLLSTTLVYQIGKIMLGWYGAELAALFWLTLPVIVVRGHLVMQQSLAVMFMLAAIFAWLKAASGNQLNARWAGAGALAASLAVLSSWEAVLLLPGLWFASIKGGRLCDRRLARLYTFAIGISLLGLIALYASAQPDMFLDTLQTVKFRMGLSDAYSHRVLHHSSAQALSFWLAILFEVVNHVMMLGVLGLLALVWFMRNAVRRFPGLSNDVRIVVCGLASPWIFWYAFMRQHAAAIDFETILAAPLAAFAMAAFAETLPRPRRAKNWLSLTLLGCLVLAPLAYCTVRGFAPEKNAESLMRVAGLLRISTPPNAVILWPTDSTLPLYYSGKHVVRLVSDEKVLQQILPELRQSFPQSPLYLALPPELARKFLRTADKPKLVSDDLILFAL
jgi:hypothetical protein